MLTETDLLEIIKKGNYLEADCSNCKNHGYYFYPEGTKVWLGEKVSISTIKHESCGHTFYELLCRCGAGSAVDKNSDNIVTCPNCKTVYSIADHNSGDVFEFFSKKELPTGVKKALQKRGLMSRIFIILFILSIIALIILDIL